MFQEKCVPEKLRDFFKSHDKLALAFSGGVDSAYLLYASLACGCVVRPYYARTAFQPDFEYQDALRLCSMLGVEMTVVALDILSVPNVAENPDNRCYFCKQALFGNLIKQAGKDGFHMIIDGTNASDDASDRPGMRALAELKVLSPLRICGITKAEVRTRSREAGLFTWDKPAYACLATRIPSGREITGEMLSRVEHAENALFKLGFSDFRVRIYGEAARIQLPGAQMIAAVEKRSEIQRAVGAFFPVVLLDLRER